jgi:regulator of CtrA degradation
MREINSFPFIDKTYRDTMELLKETRKFVSHQESNSNDNGDSFDKFFITNETAHLVSHLTNVMTWILWHKAANSGEISVSKALKMGDKHLRAEIFDKREAKHDVNLPHILEGLINRADLLHARVNRLSQMVH